LAFSRQVDVDEEDEGSHGGASSEQGGADWHEAQLGRAALRRTEHDERVELLRRRVLEAERSDANLLAKAAHTATGRRHVGRLSHQEKHNSCHQISIQESTEAQEMFFSHKKLKCNWYNFVKRRHKCINNSFTLVKENYVVNIKLIEEKLVKTH